MADAHTGAPHSPTHVTHHSEHADVVHTRARYRTTAAMPHDGVAPVVAAAAGVGAAGAAGAERRRESGEDDDHAWRRDDADARSTHHHHHHHAQSAGAAVHPEPLQLVEPLPESVVAEINKSRLSLDSEEPGSRDAVVCGHRKQTLCVYVLAVLVVIAIVLGAVLGSVYGHV